MLDSSAGFLSHIWLAEEKFPADIGLSRIFALWTKPGKIPAETSGLL